MNIVIIDDDPVARLIIEKNLRLAGFSGDVKSASNGREGLDILKLSEPKDTLVILDLNMPVMNGYALLDNLVEENSTNWDVHVLTSSSLDEDRQKCMTYSFVNGFIVKPVHLDVIKKLIA